MLRRIARACHRHRRVVVAAWLALAVAVTGLNTAFGGTFRDEFELPGSESQEAFTLLEDRGFGQLAGFSGQVVFQAEDGVDARPVRQGMEQLFARIEEQVDGARVTSPYEASAVTGGGPGGGGPTGAGLVSPDGTIAYARVDLTERSTSELSTAGDRIRTLVAEADVPGARVEVGGEIVSPVAETGTSELVGLVAAVVILLVAFGSVLAMGLPIVTALAGIGTGIGLVGLFGNLVTLPTFSNQAVAMIGIGVGIDYALLVVTRYREALHDGASPEDATVRAIDTAGRSALFAGTTVIIALLGLVTVGLALVQGLAVAITLGVLMTMAAAITLLPAVLGFAGRSIDRLGLPHRRSRTPGGEGSAWYRWSRLLQRHPWPPLVIGTVVLLALSLPVLGIRLGFADAGNRPESDTSRQAYDLLSEGFGPGANGPFLLAADLQGPGGLEVLQGVRTGLEQVEGVATVAPPIPNDDATAAVMVLVPDSAPQAEATTELVHRLRDDAIPPAVEGTDVRVLVGGAEPAAVDFAEYTAGRLPWFIAAVLVLSFLLLMTVFRSLLVPLKAVVLNLLSVGSAYGAMVAVFQWGWLSGLVGVQPGPIEAWVPLMMFAVIFGLSMDYEVFLLSRIREQYDHSGDNATAVADGLARTARVITAAAAIMFCVFGSFVFADQRALRLFGFGLALAVALDATVVRLVLVPATMELLGDRNWWLPRWLDRILPTVHVEGGADDAPSPRRGADDDVPLPTVPQAAPAPVRRPDGG